MMATTQKPFSDFNFPRKKSLIVPSHATSWMSRSGSSRGEEVTSSCPPSRARETSNYQPDSRITAPSCFDPDVEAFPATSSRKPIGTPVCEGWQENLSKFRVKSGGSNIIKLNAPGSKCVGGTVEPSAPHTTTTTTTTFLSRLGWVKMELPLIDWASCTMISHDRTSCLLWYSHVNMLVETAYQMGFWS